MFESFLEQIDKKSKKVVFIDDKIKNVEELEKLTQAGIDYVGVHYTAIERVPLIYDRSVTEFQAKFLNQIMSNEAALILIKNNLE